MKDLCEPHPTVPRDLYGVPRLGGVRRRACPFTPARNAQVKPRADRTSLRRSPPGAKGVLGQARRADRVERHL